MPPESLIEHLRQLYFDRLRAATNLSDESRKFTLLVVDDFCAFATNYLSANRPQELTPTFDSNIGVRLSNGVSVVLCPSAEMPRDTGTNAIGVF